MSNIANSPTGAIPATYDVNRQAGGKFAKGNKLAKGWSGEAQKKLHHLRTAFLDCQTDEDMKAVSRQLVDLCLNCPEYDVKLKAISLYLDRTLGKATERVEMDITSGSAPAAPVDLSPEEVLILQRVVRRSAGEDVADAEVVG